MALVVTDVSEAVATRSCGLCGSVSAPIVWKEHGYRARACACGFVFLDPAPSADAIDLTKDVHSEEFYRYPAGVRVDFLDRVTPGRRVLEVGCGTGSLLEEARRRGYEVAGLEPDAGRAQRARARLDAPVIEAYVEDAAAPAEPFDLVFHVDLMSHFPDPERALRAMVAQLGPGGLVCFESGVLGGLSPRWYRWLGELGFPDHRWLYSESAMVDMLERADLEVVRRERFGLFASHMFTPLRRLAGRAMRARHIDPRSDAPSTSRLRRWSDRVEYWLSYRVGRHLPAIGPQALFIAARPRGGPDPSSASPPTTTSHSSHNELLA